LWWRWLGVDVGLVLLLEGALLALARLVGLPSSGRVQVLAALALATTAIALLGLAVAPLARRQGVAFLRRIRLTLSRQTQ
jgi:hypothetical protein